MKKLVFLILLPLLLIANTSFGEPNLEGCWMIEQTCLGDTNAIPDPESGYVIQILNQTPDGLFEVNNCSDPNTDPCYGVIVGRNIYITCWDNIIIGVLKNNKKIEFTGQIQFPDSNEAATCKGTATKQPNCEGCSNPLQ